MQTLIIAEAGVNHNGDIKLAKQLVDAAVDAGADIVKFQTFKAEKLASKSAKQAEYQERNTGKSESQFDMLKRLELKTEDHYILIDYCKSKGIRFLSTPFDVESITILKGMNLEIGKIPSGEITNLPYLKAMAHAFSKIVMSTGMATLEEIKEALNVLKREGKDKKDITVLHCNTEYPTPFQDVNLRAMNTIAKEFDVNVGYSDHTRGIEVPIAAVALGATIIEKHFTLDRTMEGPDHKASLEPDELKQMIHSIRNIEHAMGSTIKAPSDSERKNMVIARKSIVASRDMKPGHIIGEDDLTTKRPGNGISPMQIETIIGKELKKAIKEDEVLTFEHLIK